MITKHLGKALILSLLIGAGFGITHSVEAYTYSQGPIYIPKTQRVLYGMTPYTDNYNYSYKYSYNNGYTYNEYTPYTSNRYYPKNTYYPYETGYDYCEYGYGSERYQTDCDDYYDHDDYDNEGYDDYDDGYDYDNDGYGPGGGN